MRPAYRPAHIVPVIVISQFLCTSLWFAGNAVVGDMAEAFGFDARIEGYLTIAVTLGFIVGTLVFAIFSFSDRFAPRTVFLISALVGAIANCLLIMPANALWSVLILRMAAGFCLAGIYPVGMKIAADWHQEGLGRALGYLVGALVLGTALPHGIRAVTSTLDWETVIITTSALVVIGGVLLFGTVPDGPHRKAARSLDLTAFRSVFREQKFRSAAFGYFGHMWELYAFWTFVPVMLASLAAPVNIAFWSFVIIGIGGLSCVAGGYVSLKVGSARVARVALLLSAMSCVASIFITGSVPAFGIGLLCIWGVFVIMDSPQFSTLVATTAPKQSIGTALTIVNCIGFAIAMLSIQVITLLEGVVDERWIYLVLVLGPAFGLISTRSLRKA